MKLAFTAATSSTSESVYLLTIMMLMICVCCVPVSALLSLVVGWLAVPFLAVHSF